MKVETVHLKEIYPFLGEEGRDPVLTAYIRGGLTYAGHPDVKQPGILLCPGGGYTAVSPREAEPIALRLLAMGCNVFLLKYSVAPHCFPVQLREAAAAMELIHVNSESWDTDPAKIAMMGFSAGGHLSAHYANAYDCPEVREVFPDSKPVQANILCYPVITADEKHWHKGSFLSLSGHAYPLAPEVAKKLSCEKMVTDRTPPAFLWHTAADGAVPVSNSLLYAQALADHKIPFALHIYPYGSHGLSTVDEETNATLQPGSELAQTWLPELSRWLKKVFG